MEKYSQSFVKFFEHCLAIVYANTDDPPRSLQMACDIWSKIDLDTNNSIICALKRKDYNYITKWIGYSILEKVFSVKKRRGKKITTICGMQLMK
jgi:hypothetical protein